MYIIIITIHTQYQTAVCCEIGSYYEDGTHLTEGGLYGKYAYIASGERRVLTLPSLYILLWINFAAFGLALFTKRVTNKDMSFLSSSKSPQRLCSDCMSTLWKHLTRNVEVCDEHVTLLIINCLWEVLKVSYFKNTILYTHTYMTHSLLMQVSCSKNTGKYQAIFNSHSKLLEYEKIWQQEIYHLSRISASQEVSQYKNIRNGAIFRQWSSHKVQQVCG